jgi:hypothetical protein
MENHTTERISFFSSDVSNFLCAACDAKKNSNKNTKGSAKQLAFYHQNEGLLFQFLLHESLRLFKILGKKHSSFLLSRILKVPEKSLKGWQITGGCLHRLVHYYYLFLAHFDNPPSPLCRHLAITLEKAALKVKHYYDGDNQGEKAELHLFLALRRHIRSFIALLFEKIPHYRDNPAVLFFLLRNQEHFDTICRQSIIKATFFNMFPEGIEQAYAFIAEKYAKKGFNHLLPLLELKLKQLDAAC